MKHSAQAIVYLASRSPRRQQLLAQIGLDCRVVASTINESHLAGEPVIEYVCRMAEQKAAAAMADFEIEPGIPVIAADTVISLDDQILGKPDDREHAKRMLQGLSGRVHWVYSSVHVSCDDVTKTAYDATQVQFCLLSDAHIEAYLASQEYLDKAGAYAIQGKAAIFIERIEGSYSGVMGLPLYTTSQLLNKIGFEWGQV